MNKIIKILGKRWLIKFNYNFKNDINYIKIVLKNITGCNKIIETWKIFYDKDKVRLDNPYFWNDILELHNDWLWEDNINPLYLFLKCNINAIEWGEIFFVDIKKIIKEFSKEYFELKYEFFLFNNKIIESLFIKHPLDWSLCLNYTLYWVDKKWNSKFIKFIWKNKEENKKINSFLYNVLNSNKFFLDIKKWESIIFDNYRYLHWRNSFKWYRELERFLVYL